MIKNVSLLLVALLLFASCGNKGGKSANQEFEIPDSVVSDGLLEISEEVIEGMVENISSPVEVAALINSLGIPFSLDYLLSTDYADNFNTSFKKSLALGLYGADLGYLNMYNKTSTVLDYISVIKDLADDIKVGQFFDFSTLKRLATNSTNLDSLMYISQQSFNRMENYLRENNRSSLSSLMVAGVWIEGMYLLTKVAEESDNKQIDEKIGEQKEILNQLIIILNNYRKNPKFVELLEKLEDMQTVYNDIKITIELGESEMVEQNGMLMIVQNDKQIIDVTQDHIDQITTKVREIRNYIIEQ